MVIARRPSRRSSRVGGEVAGRRPGARCTPSVRCALRPSRTVPKISANTCASSAGTPWRDQAVDELLRRDPRVARSGGRTRRRSPRRPRRNAASRGPVDLVDLTVRGRPRSARRRRRRRCPRRRRTARRPRARAARPCRADELLEALLAEVLREERRADDRPRRPGGHHRLLGLLRGRPRPRPERSTSRSTPVFAARCAKPPHPLQRLGRDEVGVVDEVGRRHAVQYGGPGALVGPVERRQAGARAEPGRDAARRKPAPAHPPGGAWAPRIG